MPETVRQFLDAVEARVIESGVSACDSATDDKLETIGLASHIVTAYDADPTAFETAHQVRKLVLIVAVQSSILADYVRRYG